MRDQQRRFRHRASGVALFAGLALAAGPALAEATDIAVDAPFTGVHAARGVEVTLAMGETAGAQAADGTDMSLLEVFVEDDILHGRRDSPFGEDGDDYDLEVAVTARRLRFLKASTGAILEGENLGLEDEAKIYVNTGGVMRVSGACDGLFVRGATGGELDAEDLRCKTVKAKARTGAILDVYASDTAEAYARLGGEVTVHGGATMTDSGTFIGGEVRPRD